MSEPDFVLIGLDIETSGTDYLRHALLSVGVVNVDSVAKAGNELVLEQLADRSFYAQLKHRSFEVVPEAMRVNKMDVTKFDLEGETPKKADEALFSWLSNGTPGSIRKPVYVPVGYNVGQFDMPFVRKWLPKSSSLISRRSLDLNALCFSLAHASDKKTFRDIKHEMNEYAENFARQHAPAGLEKHNALFDAWVAVGALEWFEEYILQRMMS